MIYVAVTNDRKIQSNTCPVFSIFDRDWIREVQLDFADIKNFKAVIHFLM